MIQLSARTGAMHKIGFTMLAPLLLALWLPLSIAADSNADVDRILALEADVDYGEYLAGDCQTCHQAVATGGAVPVIAGQEASYLIKALLSFKSGERENQVMQSVTQGLGDEEIAALALYLSNL